jgi:hypothetical protein
LSCPYLAKRNGLFVSSESVYWLGTRISFGGFGSDGFKAIA